MHSGKSLSINSSIRLLAIGWIITTLTCNAQEWSIYDGSTLPQYSDPEFTISDNASGPYAPGEGAPIPKSLIFDEETIFFLTDQSYKIYGDEGYYADSMFIVTLKEAGYNVFVPNYYNYYDANNNISVISEKEFDTLKSADLVIFGRITNSLFFSEYNNKDKIWGQFINPIMNMSAYHFQNSRLNFGMDHVLMLNRVDTFYTTINISDDTIFSGLNIPGDYVIPFATDNLSCIYPNPNGANYGEVLLSLTGSGIAYDINSETGEIRSTINIEDFQGAVVMSRWAPCDLSNMGYFQKDYNVPQGYRSYVSAGDDHDYDEIRAKRFNNFYVFTDWGKEIWLNEVKNLISLYHSSSWISVWPYEIELGGNSGTYTLDVECIGENSGYWTATVTEGNYWLTIINGASGTGNGTIDIQYYQNNTTDIRQGIIEISAEWAQNKSRYIYIKQPRKGRRIHINALNISGIEDGTADFPFNTIQEGIDLAIARDTILVYPGRYIENINIGNKENIIIGSLLLTTGDTSYIEQTIIDGNQNGQVLSISNCIDTIYINGLTITNGNCSDGGGLGGWNSNIIMKYLKVDNNIGYSSGGGIHFNNCNAAMYNSLISNNITNNSGGGFSIVINGKYDFFNSKIINNYAPNNGNGSGISSWDCEINIYNTLLVENYGSACINYDNISGSIINCTVADNPDGSFGFNNSNIQVRNCIEWGNNQNRWGNLDNIQYSNIQGGISGTGNINASPQFVNPENGDYRLNWNSPCINAGTPDTSGINLQLKDLTGNQRVFNDTVDMGAYEYLKIHNKITISYTDKCIIIDGLIDDTWEEVEKHYIDKNFINEEPTLDLATWQAVWNDTAIFILVVVNDDNHCDQWCSGAADWQSDGVEIWIDVNDNLKDGLGPDQYPNGHYQFAWGDLGFQEGIDNYFYSGTTWQGWHLNLSYLLNNPNYVYEYSIRIADLIDQNGNKLDPYSIDEIGFDVYVVDRDEGYPDRKRAVWKNIGEINECWYNMDDAGEIVFIKEEYYLDINISAEKTLICPGEEIQLGVNIRNGSGNYSYTWSSNPSGITYLFSNPVVSPNITTTYYLTVIDGEKSANDSIIITVHPLPIVNAGNDTIISQNTTAILNGTATGGGGNYLYSWSPADSLDNSFIKNPTTASLQKSNLFMLSATDYLTGCKNTGQVLVMVSGGLLGTAIYTSRDTICKGESIQLQAIPTGGTGNYTYSWRSDPAGFSSTILNPVDYPSDTTIYYFDLTDAAITKTASKKIVVGSSTAPEVTDTGSCFGNPNPFITVQSTSIKWYSNSYLDTMIMSGNSYQSLETQLGEYDYYITQTNYYHCTSPASKVIFRINKNPVVTVTASNNPIYLNGSSLLSANGALDYEWFPPDGLNKTTESMVEASPSENTTYTVTGTDENGCEGDTNITLYVYCKKCKLNNLLLYPEGIINHGCTNNVYQNNSNCSWIIYPSGAKSIYLKFDTIDIKFGDYINIYNGINENIQLLRTFNNENLPTGQIKTGPAMYIQFYSNESETGLGFSARYRINEPVISYTENINLISNLKVYPNPTTGLLNIEFLNTSEKEITIYIFNTLQQRLFKKDIKSITGANKIQMDISWLNPGLYYLILFSENEIQYEKIVIR